MEGNRVKEGWKEVVRLVAQACTQVPCSAVIIHHPPVSSASLPLPLSLSLSPSVVGLTSRTGGDQLRAGTGEVRAWRPRRSECQHTANRREDRQSST